MSQRLHVAPNCTNMDTINCQAYDNKLNKPKRGPIKSRDNSQTRMRQPMVQQPGRIIPSINFPTINSRSVVSRQSNTDVAPPIMPSNIIRKEIYDAACVEVTVKTHGMGPNQRPKSRKLNANPSDMSWGKLLKAQSSIDNVASQSSQFRDFDPLRTVHFLASELQSKISDSMPADAAIQQMITDMQLALNRVPPEVASAVLEQAAPSVASKMSNYLLKGNRKANHEPVCRDHMEPEKLVPTKSIPKIPVSEKCIQTTKSINYLETEKLQKHLEDSTEKIEAFCKQMEQVCLKLKNEKEDIEKELSRQQMENCDLKKRVKELEDAQCEKEKTISSLSVEKDDLNLELKKIKSQLVNDTNQTVDHLKEQMEKLREQKNKADHSVIDLEHQLTNMTMNKEKYEAMLSARDKQVKQIQSEMSQLQKLVNEQLMELENHPELSYNASSASIVTENGISSMMLNKKALGEYGDIIVKNSSSTINGSQKSTSLKELPSGDSSGTSTVIWDATNNRNVGKSDAKQRRDNMRKPLKSKFISEVMDLTSGSVSKTQSNMRELISQIKANAFNIPAASLSETTHPVDASPSDTC